MFYFVPLDVSDIWAVNFWPIVSPNVRCALWHEIKCKLLTQKRSKKPIEPTAFRNTVCVHTWVCLRVYVCVSAFMYVKYVSV